MNEKISNLISKFSVINIPEERKIILDSLVEYIQGKVNNGENIRLNFVCTHNSRRSHLSQIWAQTLAFHFGIKNVFCYSGGTESTAMFPKIVETLVLQGFEIHKPSDLANPIYAVKFDSNEHPIICFSKVYSDSFNPKSSFAAIMTCDSADNGCPIVFGAEARFPIKYTDPKSSDGTDKMDETYYNKSMEIGQEMFYVFDSILR
jgi:arsenate reductase (thioredoxin)